MRIKGVVRACKTRPGNAETKHVSSFLDLEVASRMGYLWLGLPPILLPFSQFLELGGGAPHPDPWPVSSGGV